MVKVLLALFVGLFRRDVVPLEDDSDPAPDLDRGDDRVAVSCSLVVFELIRSRRLRERYALLWLATGLVLVVLSRVARRAEHDRRLARRARATRRRCCSRSGSLFVILVLLHYSTVISRLTDQNTILAQRLALLETRLEERDERRLAGPAC